jgi:hypothetical protein
MALEKFIEFVAPYSVGASNCYSVKYSLSDPSSDCFGVYIQFFGGFFNAHPLAGLVWHI